MIPTNGSSFGRAGGRLRRYPGGTENASIFATVRGSIPNRRAASRRLIPSTYTARRTCPYSSTPFIPPPSAHLGRRPSHAGLLLRPCRPIRPLYEGLSLRRSHGALIARYWKFSAAAIAPHTSAFILSERQRQVTELRSAGLTYAAIGRQLGISGERVRQIEMRLLRRARLN